MTITSEPIVIVGIIDKADDLDAAAERAASEGLENTLYDETIVAQQVETCLPEPIPVDPGRIPSVITQRLSDTPTLMHEFKDRLSDHCLTDEALETYALTFCHKGKFVVVETDAGRADRSAKILRDSRASGVNRHD